MPKKMSPFEYEKQWGYMPKHTEAGFMSTFKTAILTLSNFAHFLDNHTSGY